MAHQNFQPSLVEKFHSVISNKESKVLLGSVGFISIKYDCKTVSIVYVVLLKRGIAFQTSDLVLAKKQKYSPEKSMLESTLITISKQDFLPP